MQEQRGLVRERPFTSTPQPDANQILVLASGQMSNAVERPLNALDAPTREVLREQLLRDVGRSRLAGAEQPLLRNGDI
ncbi:MAG TPA: hypothetical protein VNO30_00240 [Kofleriaceae bacterium]|nr:hypothetical protein [Kofleriaceae bacterium]